MGNLPYSNSRGMKIWRMDYPLTLVSPARGERIGHDMPAPTINPRFFPFGFAHFVATQWNQGKRLHYVHLVVTSVEPGSE